MKQINEKILLLYGLSILLGGLTGVIGSLFQIAIKYLGQLLQHFFDFLQAHQIPVLISSALLSMTFVFIAWFMVRVLAPEAAGSGVQEIEGTLLHKRPIFWRRLLPVKFIAGVLSISANMVLGREGPTIQMGGNLGEMLGEYAHIPRKRRDVLVAAGAGAGLATAFNAPLAGVLFVLEELRDKFDFTFINFKMVAITCVFATIAEHFIIGAGPAIPMDVFMLPGLKSLWLFGFLGLILGFAGLYFNKALMNILKGVDTLPLWVKVLHVLGIGLVVGALFVLEPNTVGGGYTIIHQALTLTPSLRVLALFFVVRFIATILCYSTGVPGGIFAPLLALGTLLGLVCFSVFDALNLLRWFDMDNSVHLGMFAVAGMGALFSASIRAPVTGIVLIVEMTQNYQLILPLMVVCLTSTTVVQLADNAPIYTQLLKRTLSLSRVIHERK